MRGTLTLPISRDLPWRTIGVNVTGSLVIGFFGALTLAQGRFPVSENVRIFVMVGICGGYTTFSAFSLQTLELIRAGSSFRGTRQYCFIRCALPLRRSAWSCRGVTDKFRSNTNRSVRC
jgi:protein CrcB